MIAYPKQVAGASIVPVLPSRFRPAIFSAIAMATTTPAFAAPAIDTAQLAAGEKAFAQCKACHSITKLSLIHI